MKKYLLIGLGFVGWAEAGLVVTEVAGPPTGAGVKIQSAGQDNGGNTRFRYFAERTGAPTKDDNIESAPGISYYYQRDRDLGQTFTVGAEGFKLDAVTLRVGFNANANQGAAGGAKVSMQLLEVGGTPVVSNSGSPPHPTTLWETFDPSNPATDDIITGEVYTSLRIAGGGVLPSDVGKDMFLKWDLTGADEIMLEAGKQYAFVVMFDEPAEDRGLALANNFTGSYPGGHGIRRCGSSLDRESVFVRDRDDPADVEASRQSAMFPADMAARTAISPGTLGYPDVDTYRDFRFYIEGTGPAAPEPALTTATGSGADTFIDSGAANTSQGAAIRARIRTSGALRKAYFRFDLSGLSQRGEEIDGAELRLRLAGGDDTLPDPFTVDVYGLDDGHAGESWNETMTWNNGAPAHAGSIAVGPGATKLGGFTVTGGSVAAGQELVMTAAQLTGLPGFLQADTDKRVTFIVSYATSTDKSLDFSTKENTTYGGAALVVAPFVEIAPTGSVVLPAGAALVATVDGKPELGADVSVVWSKVSGPGTVAFSGEMELTSAASFSRPGDYVLALTAVRGNFIRSVETAVRVVDSYATWSARVFPEGTAGADLAISADPDSDGFRNLLEYALASDPVKQIEAHAPIFARNGETVSLRYRTNLLAAGVTLSVMESETLDSWKAAEGLAERVVSDDGELRVTEASVPTAGKPKKFLRLRATEP